MTNKASKLKPHVAVVLLALLATILVWTWHQRVRVNVKTEQQVYELLESRSGEPVSWDELEAILGPGTEISVEEYNALTGYRLATNAAFECREWKGRDGSWIVFALDPVSNLSSFKSHVRQR